MVYYFTLALSVVINVVGFVVIYRKVSHVERKVVDLVNELGSHVGAYIDAMQDKS